VSAFAGAIYAPAVEQVMESFSCGYEVAVPPLALYNLGLAFGPVIGAPLSEQYGRKAVFVVTTPILVLFMVGASISPSLPALIICRFFAGIFASPNINNTSVTILDYIEERHRGTVMGIYYSIPSESATLAPLLGGFVVRAMGWRWTQWVAIMLAVACYIPTLFTKETYKRKILQRRAKRFGLTDALSHKSSPERRFDISSSS
jgi:MFS transporter, DHA1 family, multidrug resistance protein